MLDWVLELREAIGIPDDLSKLGIDAEQAERVARMATEDPSAGTNPIQLSQDQYRDLFLHAVNGEL